jgi:thiol-disulfide isomerase/thioredoxin
MVERSKSMARHLSNCIRALAAMLVVAPAALAQAPLVQEPLQEYSPKKEPPKNFIMHEMPEPGVVLRFEDGQARTRSLADFRGKIILLNIWATWCAPCVKEIPALDRLVAALKGAEVAVVTVSVDRKGIDAVRKAFADLDVRELVPYIDQSGQALRMVRSMGLPTSLLIDREGREIGRVVGPAAWDDATTIAFFQQVGSSDSKVERQPDRTGLGPGR